MIRFKFIRNSYIERGISPASLLLFATRLHLTRAVTPSELGWVGWIKTIFDGYVKVFMNDDSLLPTFDGLLYQIALGSIFVLFMDM